MLSQKEMLAIILYIKFLDSKTGVKLIISFTLTAYFAFKLNLINNLKECPGSYGTDLCSFFGNQQIRLPWWSYFLPIFNPNILTNSVYYGVFNGTVDVVVKRKCRRYTKTKSKDKLRIENLVQYTALNEEKIQNVILCPGFRDVHFLYKHVENEIQNHQLWLDLKTSIEPLLLMFFHSNGEWPVPQYIGACGDVIVEEYKGRPLGDFLSSDWVTRATLAVQLLKMAHAFTFNHPEFAFYFTDFSVNNIVVDVNWQIFLIDLDNVIIFDKVASKGNISILGSIHASEVLSENEYAFSPSDICNHYLSDHNYFSICKFLLTNSDGGLLTTFPSNVMESNSELADLLNKCSIPDPGGNRISVGYKLLSLLEEIIKNFKGEK